MLEWPKASVVLVIGSIGTGKTALTALFRESGEGHPLRFVDTDEARLSFYEEQVLRPARMNRDWPKHNATWYPLVWGLMQGHVQALDLLGESVVPLVVFDPNGSFITERRQIKLIRSVLHLEVPVDATLERKLAQLSHDEVTRWFGGVGGLENLMVSAAKHTSQQASWFRSHGRSVTTIGGALDLADTARMMRLTLLNNKVFRKGVGNG